MTSSPHILVCFGTRPEAIKLSPLLRELDRRGARVTSCNIGQHRELVHDVLAAFEITPSLTLDVMEEDQELSALTARILGRTREVLQRVRPDVVVVQGDTTSAMAVAIAAHQARVPVAHVEAGLRTSSIHSPWPEEANRRVISRLADLHFAPTERARSNLLGEGIDPVTAVTVGNTGLDAARMLASGDVARVENQVLVTCHRRENHADSFASASCFLRALVEARPDLDFVLPVHPNPRTAPLIASLQDAPNVTLWRPLPYPEMLSAIQASMTVVTDSGGLQEECAWFGVPCLVMRPETDRPESVETGNAVIVGHDVALALESLHRSARPDHSVFGDGYASARIANRLLDWDV